MAAYNLSPSISEVEQVSEDLFRVVVEFSADEAPGPRAFLLEFSSSPSEADIAARIQELLPAVDSNAGPLKTLLASV